MGGLSRGLNDRGLDMDERKVFYGGKIRGLRIGLFTRSMIPGGFWDVC